MVIEALFLVDMVDYLGKLFIVPRFISTSLLKILSITLNCLKLLFICPWMGSPGTLEEPKDRPAFIDKEVRLPAKR